MLDKPTGIGATGRESTKGGVEDRPWVATISASRSPDTPESWVVSEGIKLKGVAITWGVSSVESESIDLGLICLRRRRCTKITIPITKDMAAAPPMMPPAIAGPFDFWCDDDLDFVVGTLAFMLSIGTLRNGPSQSSKYEATAILLTSELMAQT